MTIKTLASQIAKREGKKSQARIGDIREILKIIATLEAENYIYDKENGNTPHCNCPLVTIEKYAETICNKLLRGKK